MRVKTARKRSRVTVSSPSAAQTIEQLALAAEKRSLRNSVDEEDETLKKNGNFVASTVKRGPWSKINGRRSKQAGCTSRLSFRL